MAKKRTIEILVFSLLCFLLTNAPCQAASWQWPKSISISVGGGMSSGAYVGTIAWSSVMEKDTGMKVRVLPEMVLHKRSRDVKQGKTLFQRDGMQAVTLTVEVPDKLAVREPGPFQARLGWIAGNTFLGFMVREDSDIKTMDDIKPGIRWPSIPSEPPYQQTFHGFFAWAQVDPEKEAVPVIYSDWGHSIKALAEKKIDVAYTVTTWPVVHEVAAGPYGIRFLEMDPKKNPEGAKRFWSKKPSLGFAKVRTGEPHSLGITSISILSTLSTREESDPELIYQFCSWMDKNFDKYKDKHDSCKLMHPEVLKEWLPQVFLPLHEGTIKYLKEKGWWSAKYDVQQQENIALVTKYVDAYKIAIATADKKEIEISPNNKEWLDLWHNIKKDIPIFRMKSQ